MTYDGKGQQHASKRDVKEAVKALEDQVRDGLMATWGARLVEHLLREMESAGEAKIGVEIRLTMTPRDS